MLPISPPSYKQDHHITVESTSKNNQPPDKNRGKRKTETVEEIDVRLKKDETRGVLHFMYLTMRKKGALKGKDNLILFFSLLVWTEFNYLSRVRLASQKIGALHLQIVALSKKYIFLQLDRKKNIYIHISSFFPTYTTCSRKKNVTKLFHIFCCVIITFLKSYTKTSIVVPVPVPLQNYHFQFDSIVKAKGKNLFLFSQKYLQRSSNICGIVTKCLRGT